MKRMSPLGALTQGLVAGLFGALAQEVFFALTKRVAPEPATEVFEPPEAAQYQETTTQTIARRVVEALAQRGPLQHEAAAGELVHYAFGGAWGGAYGIAAGTLPSLVSLRAGALFGLGVWAVSDNVILPLFRLSAWPQDYPVKTHAYAICAHAVYGAATAASFAALSRYRPAIMATLGAALLARRLPKPVRPAARRLAARGLRASLRARAAAPWLN